MTDGTPNDSSGLRRARGALARITDGCKLPFGRGAARSLLMVVLVLSGGLIAPAGNAAAASTAEPGECSSLDDFVMFLSLGAVNSDSCSRQAYVDATIQEMDESDEQQTHTDLYSAAASAKGERDAFMAPFNNYAQDTESVAWMKAEAAVAEAYQNGSSQAVAKTKGQQAIADYYSKKQINLINRWNITVNEFRTMQSVDSSEGIGAVYAGDSNSNDLASVVSTTGTTTYTLANGTTHQVPRIEVDHDYSNVGGSGGTAYYEIDSSAGVYSTGLYVSAPTNSQDKINFLDDSHEFIGPWSQLQTQESNLQPEIGNYVDATYEDYETGAINASDVISSHTAMFEYGTRSANETEGLYRSTAAIAMAGFDTPNMSTSGTMEVVYNNAVLDGVLMARNAPNGTWEVGKTYNTANITGPVFMLTTDGKKIDFGDDREFRIDSMTAKDGSTLNSTDTKQYNYKTSNTTEVIELTEQLTELRDEIESRQPDGGGGSTGGLFDGISLGAAPPAAIVAVAAAALLLLREN